VEVLCYSGYGTSDCAVIQAPLYMMSTCRSFVLAACVFVDRYCYFFCKSVFALIGSIGYDFEYIHLASSLTSSICMTVLYTLCKVITHYIPCMIYNILLLGFRSPLQYYIVYSIEYTHSEIFN